MKLIWIVLWLVGCTTTEGPREYLLSGFFPKKKEFKAKEEYFDNWRSVDSEKSELLIFREFPKYLASEDAQYSLVMRLKSKENQLLKIDPKLITLEGLETNTSNITLLDNLTYIISGIWASAPKTHTIKVRVGDTVLKQVVKIQFHAMASTSKSTLTLVSKPDTHQRVYILNIKDGEGKNLDTGENIELVTDGEAQIFDLTKIAPATWKFKVQFLCDDCAVYFGFKIFGQYVRKFQRINFRFAEIDPYRSFIYPGKKSARADGVDRIRIYTRLLNDVGGPLFQMKNFTFKLSSSEPKVQVSGPFDGAWGSYFELRAREALRTKLTMKVDMIELGEELEVNFIRMQPVSKQTKWTCLKELRKNLDPDWEVNENLEPTEEEIQGTFDTFIKEFEYRSTGSLTDFNRFIEKLSLESCVLVSDFDNLREKTVHELRKVLRTKNR